MEVRGMRMLLGPTLAALVVLGSAPGCSSTSERASTTAKDAYVVLQAQTREGVPLNGDDLDTVVSIIRRRAEILGVKVIVEHEGQDRVVIHFPGRQATRRDSVPLTDPGILEFFDLETSLVGPSIDANGAPVEHTSLYELLAAVRSQAAAGRSDAYYVFDGETKKLVAGPLETEKEAQDSLTAKPKRQLFPVPPHVVVVTCGENAVVCPGAGGAGVLPDRTYYYLFKYDPPRVPQLTGNDLELSGTGADFDPQTARPMVTIEFTHAGSRKFRQITSDEWTRGRVLNAPQHFAIVLDREIRTFPQIDYLDSSISGGIGGGRAQIEGLESLAEAKSIAAALQTGALPLRLKIVESHR
jgi:preprotein translocase subunit SecD